MALRYVELLEQEELTNIIFTETILQRVKKNEFIQLTCIAITIKEYNLTRMGAPFDKN